MTTKPSETLGVRPFGFADITDYIKGITYAIWNGPDRDPGLCSRYYAADTAIHLDGGDVVGADRVIANTRARLAAFPDFHGVIDDTIWTGDEATGYRTSMRWTWSATHQGPFVFGAASGKPVRFAAIANCVVRGQLIVEEWLGTNPLSLARQLGLADDEALARWTSVNPTPGAGAVPSWSPSIDGPGLVVAETLDRAWNGRDTSALRRGYADTAIATIGPDRSLDGGAIEQHFANWLRLLPDLSWTIDDQYWRQDDEKSPARVATQWTIRGHATAGPVRITGISHHHVHAGQVIAEWTHYDELALLRQCGELP